MEDEMGNMNGEASNNGTTPGESGKKRQRKPKAPGGAGGGEPKR